MMFSRTVPAIFLVYAQHTINELSAEPDEEYERLLTIGSGGGRPLGTLPPIQ